MIALTTLLALAAFIAALVLAGRLHGLSRRQDVLESRLRELEGRAEATSSPAESPAAMSAPAPGGMPAEGTFRGGDAAVRVAAVPPVLASPGRPAEAWIEAGPSPAASGPGPGIPPLPSPARARSVPAVDWEKFMGIRLFAWLGGLALFLGVAYFVKYSFEHNLIPPSGRVLIGLATGIGLVAGGLRVRQREYAVTAQTLRATGVVVLYAALFAGNQLYHLPWLPTAVAFLALSGVTALAFILATQTRALVIALLGMLGGFLTPLLLSEGGDQPLALFGYIALLDAGLIAVALRCRWLFLPALGSVGTAALLLLWSGRYFGPDRGPMALLLFPGFIGLFTAALPAAHRREDPGRDGDWLGAAVAILAATTLAFVGGLLLRTPWTDRPGTLFTLVLAADLGLLAAAWFRARLAPVQVAAGVLVFAFITAWMARAAEEKLLAWSILLSLAFAALHVGFPLARERYRPGSGRSTTWASQLFPPLALLGMLVPLLRLEQPSMALWPAILALDVLALALAAWAAGVAGAIAALVFTLVTSAFWIGRLPAEATGLGATLVVLTGTSALFVIAGAVLARRGGAATGPSPSLRTPVAGPIPLAVLAALLPFLSLAQIFGHLRLPEPSAVFAAMAVLAVLLFALTGWLRLGTLPLVGLAGLAFAEHAWWWSLREPASRPVMALLWAVGFLALWATAPFWRTGRLGELRPVWMASVLAGLPQFHLVYRIIERYWPNGVMGLVPLAFAIPPGLALMQVARRGDPADPERLGRLAWLGGGTLFFLTLALPVQFDRHWLTLGLALEGAALLGLFRKVPHPGLRLVGVAILLTVFVRLTVNPSLFEGRLRGPFPFWNEWLYTYALGATALFAGARLLPAHARRIEGWDVSRILVGLGTVLLFILLNLQIADLFTAPGEPVRFDFSGHLGRDMTTTLAWALFALALVVTGLARRAAAARWAGLGLLAVSALKLFLNDLARLEQLYRVGALIGVALVALAASVLYQRFVAREGGLAPSHPGGPEAPRP